MVNQTPVYERFLVGVDGKGYGPRSARHQQVFQERLVELLNDAADRAGIDRPRWDILSGGDGEMAVLPPDIDLAAVVGSFIRFLNIRLAENNDDSSPGTQIRLRVAMHSGVLVESAYDYAGEAPTTLSRLLNSDLARQALDAASTVDGADLALVVSEPVYQKVVLSGFGGLRPLQFRKVTVDNKTYSGTAYVHIPGCDMRTIDLGEAATDDGTGGRDAGNGAAPSRPDGPPNGSGVARQPQQSSTTNIAGGVNSAGGTIAIGNIGGPPEQGWA